MNECGSEWAYDNIAAGAFENKFSKHHNNIIILFQRIIHSYTRKLSADAPLHNRANDINLHFERWILNIELLQQWTHPVG